MGVVNLPRNKMYWSSNRFLGNQGFQNTMSRNRFDKLQEYFHINDNSTRAEPGSQDFDRLHKLRPLIAMTRKNFLNAYNPGKNQTIDEGMVHYKGRFFAKQFEPYKPIKRGLKVHTLSTLCNPVGDYPVVRRVPRGREIEISRPPPVTEYQRNMGGVDRCMQHRSKNPVGRPSKKYWKYMLNFILEVCLINAHIIWQETPGTRKPRTPYQLVDFRIDVAEQLIDGFSSRILERQAPRCQIELLYVSERLNRKRSTCKWCTKHSVDKKRRETLYGCLKCDVHLCQGGCFHAYHSHHHIPV